MAELNLGVHPEDDSGSGISCLFSPGCLRRSLTCQRTACFLKNILLRTSPPNPFTEASLKIDYQANWGGNPMARRPSLPFPSLPSDFDLISNSPISLISCILAPSPNSKSLILKCKSLRITIKWTWISWQRQVGHAFTYVKKNKNPLE